ncbi:MAG: bile acid:sodium symporter family protein [Planctomycetaceae bacterium]
MDGWLVLMLQRFLLVWLMLLSSLALGWDAWCQVAWSAWFGSTPNPFLATKSWLPHLFALTMFAVGCMLPRDEIRRVLDRWPTVLGGTLVQYAAMPVLAYGIGHALQLQGDMLLGVILVGCVPGAMASNVLTLTARGNVSYSVSLTTSATLLSPLVVPLALYLAVRVQGIDRLGLARDAFVVVLVQVAGPVVVGHFLSRRIPSLGQAMRSVGPVIANLTILWIIAVVVHLNAGNLFDAIEQIGGGTLLRSVNLARTPLPIGSSSAVSQAPLLLLALLLVNVIGYTVGWSSGRVMRLPVGMRKALVLEVGMQNAGLGATMAQQLFAGRDLVALPPALYTFGCMMTGTILAQLWSSRSSDDPSDTVTTDPTP